MEALFLLLGHALEWAGPLLRGLEDIAPALLLRGLFQYPRFVLALMVVAAVLLAPFLFPRWKSQSPFTYAGLEIAVSLATLVALLPWEAGVFDVGSYASYFSLVKALPVLSAIYVGVRGIENWGKAVALSGEVRRA